MNPRGTVRVAVLGVGAMGRDHVHRLATRTAGAELVAVGDADVDRTDAVAAEFGVRAVHDADGLIADSAVDALVVATPAATHEPLVLRALAVGKPVLCEKPLTTTPEAARRIVEAEAALDRPLVQVGFMRRFDAGYRRLRELVASGELGAPLFLHCAHRNATTPPNFSSEMLLLDSLVHEVDAVRFLLDEEVVAVRVLVPRSTSAAPEGLLDPQFVVMETASGVLVDVEVLVNSTVGYEVRTELVAERGQARAGSPGGVVVQSGGGWGGPVRRTTPNASPRPTTPRCSAGSTRCARGRTSTARVSGTGTPRPRCAPPPWSPCARASASSWTSRGPGAPASGDAEPARHRPATPPTRIAAR